MTRFYPKDTPQKESNKGLLPAVSTVEDGPMAGMEGCMSLSFNEHSALENARLSPAGFAFSHRAGEIRVDTRADWEDGKNTAYGLWHKTKKQILLSVFRFSDAEDTVTVDLSRYGKVQNADCIYPASFPIMCSL